MKTNMRWKITDRVLDLSRRALVMGIVNVTPDSFSDGGLYANPERAAWHGFELESQGADILDVGGESTRPGADPVGVDEELRRVVPVVRQLARTVKVPISVDTMKAEVARQAIEAGAHIINDVTALRGDPAMAAVAAETGAGVVLMHMIGTPRTMQQAPVYGDVVAEVAAHLRERMAAAEAAGIDRERIALDPGIGFGKTLEHNVEIFRRMGEFIELGRPLLIGPSRKTFIGKLLGDAPPNERLEGTIAAVVASICAGARIVRVHDVAPVAKAVKVAQALAPWSR
ncbi:MAG: dihydropteroate synthase [Candidatus Sumerlaeia bacterium]